MLRHAARSQLLRRLAGASAVEAAAPSAPSGLQLLLLGPNSATQYSERHVVLRIHTASAHAADERGWHPSSAWRDTDDRASVVDLAPRSNLQRRNAHNTPAAGGASTINTGSPATSPPVGAPAARDLPLRLRQQEAAPEAAQEVAELAGDPTPQPLAGAGSSQPPAAAAPQHGPPDAMPGHPTANAFWGDDGVFEYHAPLSSTVRRLKMLSLFSCAASLAAAPVIVALDPGAAASSLAAKASIGGMLACFGCFTTGLLHWFVSPYVHTFRYDPANGECAATRLSIMARPKTTRFRVEDAQFADTMRPQTTFKVRGSYYYLDPDHLGNRELYELLYVPDPEAPPAEAVAAETAAADALDRQRR